MPKFFVRVLLCLILVAAALSGSAAQAQTQLKVLATFSILGDLAQNVGGDKIALTVLVPAGSDTHTFEPAPTDAAKLTDATLILEIGAEFESWLDGLYVSSGTKASRIVLTDGMELLDFAEGHDHEHKGEAKAEGTKEADHDHEHGEKDPHVWHDVTLVIRMVEKIRDAFAAADAANAEVYKANAATYIEKLNALDALVKAEIAKLPEARRKLITTHDTFAYFGARYGFEVDSALGATTEAADPAAGEIAKLVEEIKKAGVPAIFADNVTNPRLMEQIAREAGVVLGPILYTDALGEPGSAGETYLKMIEYNVKTIVEALGK